MGRSCRMQHCRGAWLVKHRGGSPVMLPASVEADVLVRAVEGKGRDVDPEALALIGLHFVATLHDSAGRGQGAAAGIDEAGARLQDRLFAHHTRTLNLLRNALGVGDPPV